MFRWKILAVLGLAFGLAGVGWGYAQEQRPVGFYELRVYTAQPGKRDALAARFASRTAAIYARHGTTNVGYWIAHQSDPELGIRAETPSSIFAAILPRKNATSASPPPMTIRNSPRW
jgi:NIPSNAP